MDDAPKLAYPHIVRTTDVRAGKACIAGTRIAVVDVAIAHEQGLTPEEIQTYFSSRPLTLAEVHSALAYHYDLPEELEEYLRRGEQLEKEMDAAWEEYVARHGGAPPEEPAPEDRHIAKPVPWPPVRADRSAAETRPLHHAGEIVEAFEALASEASPFAHPIRYIKLPR